MMSVPAAADGGAGPGRLESLLSGSGLAEQILHCVPASLLLLDAARNAVFVNCHAAALLAGGEELRLAGRRLAAAAPEDQRRLESWLARAALAQEPLYLRLGRSGRNQVWLQARGIARRGAGSGHLLLMLGHARSGLEFKHRALRQLFDMSKSEADIAVDLALGGTAARIACARVVSINTVRTQIRKVLQKSGSERIVDLIRVVASVPDPNTSGECGCGQHDTAPVAGVAGR